MSKWKSKWKLNLLLLLSLALLPSIAFSTSTQAPAASLLSQVPPPPPPTPRPPSGNRHPGGGGLGGSNPACQATPHPLTALMPENSQGSTTSEHPTFWFYIPYSSKEVSSGEFSLLSRDGSRYVYKATFSLPQTSGIVSITLPSALNDPLKLGEYYHWYMGLNCIQSTSTRPDLVIDGWIHRVPSAPESAPESAIDPAQASEFSYDALTDTANRYLATPTDQQRQLSWTNSLAALGLRELAQVPLAAPLQLKSEPVAN